MQEAPKNRITEFLLSAATVIIIKPINTIQTIHAENPLIER
jgi:hypothetical protein